ISDRDWSSDVCSSDLLGFSRTDYAAIIKGVGLAATLIGGFAGGFVARIYPLATSLWIGGLLQAVANLTFSAQAVVGHNGWMLTRSEERRVGKGALRAR